MKRITWILRPGKPIGWTLTRDSKTEFWFLFKYRAERFARRLCNFEWQHYHYPSELLIADRKGRYTDAGSTYGHDPSDIPG